jgi:hypothetical protein
MLSEKTWQVIHRIYDYGKMAASALICAIGLYFIVFILPHVSEIRAEIENRQILEITSENRNYCEKWGMREGAETYLQCTLDLQQIRANVEQRIVAEPF